MTSATSTEFRVGECLPGTGWVMHRVLGRGGMGLVLEVGKGRNFRAAMKILRPPPGRVAEYEARFEEEAEVMTRLRHPNIVQVFDCGVLQDGSPFLLMELLRGRTMRTVSREDPAPLAAHTIWKIVGQICAGLTYAHGDSPPVVHRDIKPTNIFLHSARPFEDQVKLLDFGIAQVLPDAEQAPDDSVVGTPFYMAPEVLRNEPIGPKADLYALAVLVYALLTQAYPWPVNIHSAVAVTEAHLVLRPMAPSRWKSWIPKRVDACLMRALAKNPDDRQASVAAFYEELADLEFADDRPAKVHAKVSSVATLHPPAGGAKDPVPSPAREATPPEPLLRAATRASLERADSRVSPPVVGREPGRDTIWRPIPRPSPANPNPARTASEPPAPEGDATASGQALRVAAPRAGAAERRAARRSRAAPAALALGTAALLTTAVWIDWRAGHPARSIEPPSPAERPSALTLALAPPVDPAAVPEVAPTEPAAERDAAGAREPAVRTQAVPTAPKGPSEVRRPPATPPHPSRLAPPVPSNPPDDFISRPTPAHFGEADAGVGPNWSAPGDRSARESAPPPRSSAAAGRSTSAPDPVPSNLDDYFFGRKPLPPAIPAPSSLPAAR